MVNVWLIIVIVVMVVLLFVANSYFIIYFQHPEDKYTSWIPKIIIVVSMLIGEFCVLMLPLDVANRGPPDGNIPMSTLWLIIYCLITCFAVIVIPFTMFWYEEEDPEKDRPAKRLSRAAVTEVIVIIVFAVIYVVAYIFFGIAEIGVQKLNAPLTTYDNPMPAIGCEAPCLSVKSSLALRISPILFLITEIDFVGYFLLVFLGGIGMAALPFDLVLDWKHRPHAIPRDQYMTQKTDIGRRAEALLEIGNLILQNRRTGAKGRKERDRYNRWRQTVELLDGDWKHLKASYEISGLTIILSWLKLLGGVFSVILTWAWILHVLLYLVVPGHKILFLNGLLQALNNAWGFLGVIAYAIFAFYLLLCVMKGVTKFGMRFFLFLPIYPMKIGETSMGAFLFNTMLFIISSLTVTHFCSDAFSSFARTTDSNQVFVLSINSLRIIKYWFTYSVFGFLLIPLLAIIYLGIKPNDKAAAKDPESE